MGLEVALLTTPSRSCLSLCACCKYFPWAAQIEHFVDPNNKKHPKFASIADKELVLFGRVR